MMNRRIFPLWMVLGSLASTVVAQNRSSTFDLCLPALVSADSNQDGSLQNRNGEFLAFINAFGAAVYPSCYEPLASLTPVLQAAFPTLACLGCTPFPLCCLNANQININGADTDERSDEDQSRLENICSTTRVLLADPLGAMGGSQSCEAIDGEFWSGGGDDGNDDDPIVGDDDGFSYGDDEMDWSTFDMSACVDTLTQADADGNQRLTEPEYLTALQLHSNCTGAQTTLTLTQQSAFTALKVYACTGSRNPLACVNANDGISIEGVLDSDKTNRTTRILREICQSFESLNVLGCGTDVVEEDDDLAACIDILLQADSDGDEQLTQQDFATVLRLKSNCTVPELFSGLSTTEQAIFTGIVAMQCLDGQTGLGFNCLALNGESQTISIEGVRSESRTPFQIYRLQAVCGAMVGLDFFGCLLDDVGSPVVNDGPSLMEEDALADCMSAMESADEDDSATLTREEFRRFVDEYNQCGEGRQSLNVAESTVFSSLACLSTNLTSLDCISNEAATISLYPDIAAVTNFQRTVLSSVCLSTSRLGCQDFETPEIPPTTEFIPELSQACVDDILAADVNNDGHLTNNEFLQLAVRRNDAEVSCNAPEQPRFSLTSLQQSSFQGLACTSCLASGATPACCLNILNTGRIDIAAAAGIQRNAAQSAFLSTICLTADAQFPSYECSSLDEGADCLLDSRAADTDEDGYLDLDQFYKLLLLRGVDKCYSVASVGQLPETMRLAFLALSCTSCVSDGEQPTCCARRAEGSKISVNLPALCASIDLEVSQSSCSPDGTLSDKETATSSPIGSPILGDCETHLQTVDRDGDGYMNKDEFYDLITLVGADSCYEMPNPGQLTTALNAMFTGLACTSCVADGELPTCCLRGVETSKVSVSLVDAICLAVNTEVSRSSCPDVPVPPNDATKSPEGPDVIPSPTTPTPETPLSEPTSSARFTAALFATVVTLFGLVI